MNYLISNTGLYSLDGFLITIIAVVILLFTLPPIIGYWKIYEKAGKSGWASLIPIYGTVVLLEIVGKPSWWIFLLMIPFVNIYYSIVVINQLANVFGKNADYTIGIIIFPMIFIPILGFGKAVYRPQRFGIS